MEKSRRQVIHLVAFSRSTGILGYLSDVALLYFSLCSACERVQLHNALLLRGQLRRTLHVVVVVTTLTPLCSIIWFQFYTESRISNNKLNKINLIIRFVKIVENYYKLSQTVFFFFIEAKKWLVSFNCFIVLINQITFFDCFLNK